MVAIFKSSTKKKKKKKKKTQTLSQCCRLGLAETDKDLA